jgi:ubiquinone/menaquinone biosynthesis C-methylase UbiE
MDRVDLAGRNVLEIGPGCMPHLERWRGRPAHYVVADTSAEMLNRSADRLTQAGVPHTTKLVDGHDSQLSSFGDAEFDLVISFYSLEHLWDFDNYLTGILRVLRIGGQLAGAIPCEGGLAWGLGRFLTTSRWMRRDTNIDFNKIICWGHPNFADRILSRLDERMIRRRLRYWPTQLPSIDLNLVSMFIYEKG